MSVILLFAAAIALVVVMLWPVKRVRRGAPVIELRRSDPNAHADEPDAKEEAAQQALFFYLLGQIMHPGRSEDGA